MNRAILYARVSSQRQADKDLSIPSQFEQIWNGGPYPLGYRPQKSTDDKGNIHTKLEIDPENVEVIERIFQMYLLGKGIKAIAIVLNAEGRKTNYGLPFSITTLELAIREA